jgi:hypothetical protein
MLNMSSRKFSEFIPYSCLLINDANAAGFVVVKQYWVSTTAKIHNASGTQLESETVHSVIRSYKIKK